jgi:MoxR-like ATPase
VTRRLVRRREEVLLDRITDAAGVLAMQEAVEGVVVDESVGRYCVALVVATREHPDVLTGSSPRGSLGLVLAARAFALLRGRDYVIPEDVKAVARSVLSHRITVKPELWMTQASGRRVVDAVLGQVPTPTTLRGPER